MATQMLLKQQCNYNLVNNNYFAIYYFFNLLLLYNCHLAAFNLNNTKLHDTMLLFKLFCVDLETI